MNAATAEVVQLPAPVARRNISEAAWRTAMNSLFPGAKAESVIMVFDYCAARKLDPLKKPCHIVPMQVKDAATGQYTWRDVVMPGIYEYRTTAARTGEYLGHSKPMYGPMTDYLGVSAPEYCKLTAYRWNAAAQKRCEYPVQIFFRECAATKKDKDTKEIRVNERWSKAPIQMLTKCTEAAALREAFPDELGGESTADEMEGRVIDVEPEPVMRADPRGDLSDVDFELRDRHVSAIADILNCDHEELEISKLLNEYVAEFLQKYNELYIAVLDELASKKIIGKAAWRKYLAVANEAPRDHG